MSITIKAEDLKGLTVEQQVGVLLWAYKRAKNQPVNGEIRETVEVISQFEDRYKIKSIEVHAAIDDGRLEEDMDVCRWIMAINRLERLERLQNAQNSAR